MAEKTLDEMTEVQKMRHWMDIVQKHADSDDGDCKVESVTESVDKTEVTIIIKKKK